MHKKNIIAASILSADFAHLGRECKSVLQAGADVIHFDVMDHHFVPNLTFGAHIAKALRDDGITADIDVHLMVTDPESYIEPFRKAGANRLTFHPVVVKDPLTLCKKIHDAGMQAGIAYNPDKPVDANEKLLFSIDMILIMSVFCGLGGQAFIPDSIPKIKSTRALIQQHNPKILLGVDGGVKVDNIGAIANAGADFFVIGSGLFDTKDYAQRIIALRQKLKR